MCITHNNTTNHKITAGNYNTQHIWTQLHTLNFRIKNTYKNPKDKSIQSLGKMTYLFLCWIFTISPLLWQFPSRTGDFGWWFPCFLMKDFLVFGYVLISPLCFWVFYVLEVPLCAGSSSMWWWLINVLMVPWCANSSSICWWFLPMLNC